jgi:hypothetical protein
MPTPPSTPAGTSTRASSPPPNAKGACTPTWPAPGGAGTSPSRPPTPSWPHTASPAEVRDRPSIRAIVTALAQRHPIPAAYANSSPSYEGVLEPLFHLAEEVPFDISRIIANG